MPFRRWVASSRRDAADDAGRRHPVTDAATSYEDLDPGVAAWLVTDAGLAAVRTATEVLRSVTDPVQRATQLRRSVDPDRAAVALQVAAALDRLAARGADTAGLLVTRVGAEQASDPVVAAWRAQRYLGADVWDLCAGIGGDALALGAVAGSLTCVERSAARATLLRHNLAVRGVDAEVVVADALEVRATPGAWLHADPGRRVGERRIRSLRATQPPVDTLLAAHRDAPACGVVVGPGVDLHDPALPSDAEVEFVQRGDQLVEAVLWLGALRGDRRRAVATATLLDPRTGSHETRSRSEEHRHLPVGQLGDHLVEVVPAAVRARLHDRLGDELPVPTRRLARRRALLTTDGAPPRSRWYRARPILGVLPPRPKAVRRWLRDHVDGPVELVVHGLDLQVDGWWRALGQPPRGPQGVRIELVRRDDDAVAVVTDARLDPRSADDGPQPA